ncbi:MAG: Bifunctional ribulose 5-phosphate reductase/CDP-ribitol pyrophosphorylase Bcs1 [Chlamydiia bacterium]|nr:Bifunctional ribulose 5-phosphate reductase/CDP-ribitol pyrophosphorylase Bcs1 [Chlamydiia bacterium]MCH9616233.1 Bifunctional ribulose 5-phosphate reductase/CDP-ribitol pyrophosphorylase Bcs1 [Chlamydiia bacterium]MCH9629781.1 Bifunctional ribulose 5-phosphate reductase/CDP-ribitol pyrophosphorylase Bcs1 [Chlamydiia bacterium]
MIIKAILLMGGSGERFKDDLPKQFVRLSGKPIYQHTLDTLESSGLFDEIICVCHPGHIIEGGIPGGKTRQESSYLGLLACGPDTDIVLIHDAVRPFVTHDILRANIEAAKTTFAVDTCIPTADTIVQGTSHITDIPDRSTMLRGQTPQTFNYDLILKAHQTTPHKNATDDCRLVHEMGHPVSIVPGSEENIKITTKLDLYLAEQIQRSRSSTPTTQTNSLKNKRIAVAGGMGGIGTALVKALKTQGAIPLILSRTSPDYPIDLTDQKAVQQLFKTLGPLDGLINCQGLLDVAPLSTLTFDQIQAQINVNYTSIALCCKAATLSPGGHILNFASSSFSRGRPNYAIYSSSKAAVVNFTQGLAEERPHHCINVLSPSRTDTPMRRKNFSENTRLLTPEEVAKAAIDVLTGNATGCLITV